MQLQGEPKGLEWLWILPSHRGLWIPPRHPRLRLVLPTPRLTRILLRQGPVPHLSKSEVSRLADRGAALGHGTKLLTYPEELGFLMTHSGAEFRRGRSSDLCAHSALVAACAFACLNTQDLRVVRKKMDWTRGAEPLSVISEIQYQLHISS